VNVTATIVCGWSAGKQPHQVKMDSKGIVNKVHCLHCNMRSKQAGNFAQLKLMKSKKQDNPQPL
jgi:hypothetical protein